LDQENKENKDNKNNKDYNIKVLDQDIDFNKY
jgi:hypothetical protein